MEKTSRRLEVIITLIIVIVIGVVTNFILSKITPQPTPDKTPVVQEVPKPSQYPDYDLLKDFHSLQIVTNTESYALQPNNITGRIIKTLYPKGKFDRMYVFIKASVDNGKPLSIYDDVWLTFNNQGGHILPTESLPTPPADISWLLYSAQSLPYKSVVDSSQSKSLDALTIFNEQQKLGINIFLSTARKGGLIQDFSIYYECSNDTPDCSITEK